MSESDIKAFEFATKKAAATETKDAVGEFTINGETFYVRHLADSHLAYLVHRAKSKAPDKVIAAVLNFMEAAMLPESAERFEEMVLDTDDGGGLEMTEVVEVFEHVLTLVSALPTGSPKPSARRRPTAGSSSRATTRAKV